MRAASIALVLALTASCAAPSDAPDAGRVSPSERCASCHMQDFLSASDPVHVGEKPTACGVCHTQRHWHPDVLNHDWELVGAHARGHCFFCHEGDPPVFEGTPTECNGCHARDYARANASLPFHSRFPTTCGSCHDTVRWDDAQHEGRGGSGPTDAGAEANTEEVEVPDTVRTDAPAEVPSETPAQTPHGTPAPARHRTRRRTRTTSPARPREPATSPSPAPEPTPTPEPAPQPRPRRPTPQPAPDPAPRRQPDEVTRPSSRY